jgi:hypothetical protein
MQKATKRRLNLGGKVVSFQHTLTTSSAGKSAGTHCKGGWVNLKAGLDRCEQKVPRCCRGSNLMPSSLPHSNWMEVSFTHIVTVFRHFIKLLCRRLFGQSKCSLLYTARWNYIAYSETYKAHIYMQIIPCVYVDLSVCCELCNIMRVNSISSPRMHTEQYDAS